MDRSAWFDIPWYDTEGFPCRVCGSEDILEPRFFYAVCGEHSNIPPTHLENYTEKCPEGLDK